MCPDHSRGWACDPHLASQTLSPGNLILEPSERTEKFMESPSPRMREDAVHGDYLSTPWMSGSPSFPRPGSLVPPLGARSGPMAFQHLPVC